MSSVACGVLVEDENIVFLPDLISEIAVLSKGQKARATICGIAEEEGEAFTEAIDVPILAPANRKEIRKRAYGLAQCVGSAIGEELQQRGLPEYWQGAKTEEFVMRIVADAFCGDVKEADFGNYGDVERICLNGGGAIRMFMYAIFTKGELRKKPVSEKMLSAFLRGFRGAFEVEESA